jgi:hypothetical protein
MNQTEAPFLQTEKSSVGAIVAGVTAIAAVMVYFLIFSGFAFMDYAQAFVKKENMQGLLAALGTGGVTGAMVAARRFVPARGHLYLAGGFAACCVAALLTLAARSQWMLIVFAVPVGFSTGWTTVVLSMCLRPTLHFNRLGMWCGLGTGIAYALCNQPFVFEASQTGKIVIAAVVAALGSGAALWMRATPSRVSSLPDYEFRAATGWIIALFVVVFLDTLIFYIIQNSVALKQLAWETPLILLGNAFVHLCAAFIAGLMLDQRRAGIATLAALLLLLASGIVLQMQIDNFPKARMLYIAGVSIYSTVLIYVPARGGRIQFSATLYALSAWMGSALALSAAMVVEARRVPAFVMVLAFVIGVSALFARMLWLRRAEQMESERLVMRRSA